jgi:hypothetical protein
MTEISSSTHERCYHPGPAVRHFHHLHQSDTPTASICDCLFSGSLLSATATDTRRPLLRTDLCNSRHRDQTERCMHRLHPNLSMAPPHSALIFCFRFSDSFISTSYRTGISLHIAARSATLACTGIFSPFLALFFRGWFCRFDLVVIVRIYPPSFISGRSSFVFFFGFAEGRESGMDAASDAELIATME